MLIQKSYLKFLLLNSAVAKRSPEMVEELAVSMAKAMAASGASGDDIVKAMQEALAATGASKESIAHTLLAAMASSRASPDVIAKTMLMALQDTGMYSNCPHKN